MSFIDTKDITIYYEKSPSRSKGPLLYIGGTGSDLRNRPNQLNSPLTEHFELIGYDQRGLGQTSKPLKKIYLYLLLKQPHTDYYAL